MILVYFTIMSLSYKIRRKCVVLANKQALNQAKLIVFQPQISVVHSVRSVKEIILIRLYLFSLYDGRKLIEQNHFTTIDIVDS